MNSSINTRVSPSMTCSYFSLAMLLTFCQLPALAQDSLDIRKPSLDAQGRFWVYPGALVFQFLQRRGQLRDAGA